MKNLLSILSYLLAIILIASCQNPKSALDEEVVSEWIQSTMDSAVINNDVNFLSVSINFNRHSQKFSYHGTTHSEVTPTYNEHTQIPIYNLSKIFTGIIVNSLIDEEKLALEEPVSTYLSDLLNAKATESFNNIRFEHLVYHRSGITDNDCTFFNSESQIKNRSYTEEKFIEDLNNIDLNPEDYRFEYSNFGYAIIGFICEQVSGQSYEALLEKYVIDKFELAQTGLISKAKVDQNLLATFQEDERDTSLLLIPAILAPAMGLSSNLADLSKLQNQQVRSYHDYFERGMMTSLVLTALSERTKIDLWKYGTGFMIITNQDSKYFGYYQPSPGPGLFYLFSTYPDRGITLFSSKDGPWLRDLGLSILDGMVDEQYMLRPKIRSLAWTLYSVIDTKGIEPGLKWYHQNRNTKRYRLVESEMNTIGYRILREGKTKAAIEVFKINVSEYPESSNVYDSLGEAYLDDGQEELAIVNYQKSLDMDPGNSRAKRVLRRLQEEESE